MSVTLKTPYIKDIVFSILEKDPNMDYQLFKYRLSKTEFKALTVLYDTFCDYKSLYKKHLKGITEKIQDNNKYHLRDTLLIAISKNPSITYAEFIKNYGIKCSSAYFYTILKTYRLNNQSGLYKRIFTPYCQIEYVRRLLFDKPQLTFEQLIKLCPFYVAKDLYKRIIKERGLKLQKAEAKPKANEQPTNSQTETILPRTSDYFTKPQKETMTTQNKETDQPNNQNTKSHEVVEPTCSLRDHVLFALIRNPAITYDQFIAAYNLRRVSRNYFYIIKHTYKVNSKSKLQKNVITTYSQYAFLKKLLVENNLLTFEEVIDLCPFYVNKNDYFAILQQISYKKEKEVTNKPAAVAAKTKSNSSHERLEPEQGDMVQTKKFNEQLEYIISGYETIRQVLDFLGRNAGLTKENKKFLLLKLSQGLDEDSKDISWLRNVRKLS